MTLKQRAEKAMEPPAKRRRCAFCGEYSKILCDWPVILRRSVRAWMLKPGDRVFPFRHFKAPVTLTLARPIFASPNLEVEWVNPAGSLLVYRDAWVDIAEANATCSKPACFRHHRSVGEHVDYCEDHWKEMDANAAVVKRKRRNGTGL